MQLRAEAECHRICTHHSQLSLCLWQWLLVLLPGTYQHSLFHSEVSRWIEWIFGHHHAFLTPLELLLQETILRCRQRGKDQSSEGVLLPPKYTYLNFLNSSPSTFLFWCPERHVSFCSHWHPLLSCHIVYSSCKNTTSVVMENETQEERATWSARTGTEQLEGHQHSTMSALQRWRTKSALCFSEEMEVMKTQTARSTKIPTSDALFQWICLNPK